MSNPLSKVDAWDTVATGYSQTTMSSFQCYAHAALKRLNLKKGDAILDIACGPGTFGLEFEANQYTLYGVDFSKNMLAIAAENTRHQPYLLSQADGQHLPFQEACFDAAVSLFGLMFFPDRVLAYKEITRTLKPGGRILISSWAPVVESPAFELMFTCLQIINPDLPDPKTSLESLENPRFFEDELRQAGFTDIEINACLGEFTISDTNEFWQSMVAGSAPIAMMKKNMPSDLWQSREQAVLNHLEASLPNRPSTLTSKAWLAYAVLDK